MSRKSDFFYYQGPRESERLQFMVDTLLLISILLFNLFIGNLLNGIALLIAFRIYRIKFGKFHFSSRWSCVTFTTLLFVSISIIAKKTNFIVASLLIIIIDKLLEKLSNNDLKEV